MPHAVYLGAFILCPWSECGFRIALIDFRLELAGDAARYARVLRQWGWTPGYGVVGRCPGCRQYVIFRVDSKQAISDPTHSGLEILPDNWHEVAVWHEEQS